jgi:hypothetical protein
MTVKLCELVALPPRVKTVSGPVVAQAGTVAVSVPFAWGVAGTPFAAPVPHPVKSTSVFAWPPTARFVPIRVMSVPTGPLLGVKPLSVGDGIGVGVGGGRTVYVSL